jgi:hypothetical protein
VAVVAIDPILAREPDDTGADGGRLLSAERQQLRGEEAAQPGYARQAIHVSSE